MKTSLKTLLLVFVVASLALVTAAIASAGPEATASATKTVKVADNSYSRSSISIKKNDTIKFNWQNTDNDHNVTTKSGPSSFNSKTEDGNFSYSHKFAKTGTYSLHCTIHPKKMKLSVTVTK